MKTFLYADPHFGHAGVTQFLRADGTKLRPWDNVKEMDEALVHFYNTTVTPGDKVYFLGDIAFKPAALHIVGRLHGDKVLIKGNHDTLKLSQYSVYFRDIRAYGVFNKFLLSHIPVHPSQKARWKANIHGHLHSNLLDDPWYCCVSVEQTHFKPIDIQEVMDRYETV
jgi:calcineurin-like phosphoesterase family protein